MKNQLIEHLNQFISENKKQKMVEVLENRTNHITIALENIFQSQNASAVLRSCEAFGIQNVYIIENDNTFKVNPKVVMGASKWLDIHRFDRGTNNTKKCIEDLKSKGYKIIATSPHASESISEIPLNQKTAFLFGTELRGLSDEAMGLADGFVQIPMYGFTESFNISVSVSLTLNEVAKRIRNEKVQWTLSEDEKNELQLQWCRKIVKNAHLIEKEYRLKNKIS